MRRGATCTARAKAFWLKFIGFKNSSSRISPGWGLGKSPALTVIVDDFDMLWSSFIPNKADAPLALDVGWQPSASASGPNQFRFGTGEALDHNRL
jgi:hypothetical protein